VRLQLPLIGIPAILLPLWLMACEQPILGIMQITGIMQTYRLFADQGKLIISELLPLRAYLQFATKAT
jgi:hypothetical protein